MVTAIDPGKLKPRGFTVIGNISGGGTANIPWYINDDNFFVLEPNPYSLDSIQIDSERLELVAGLSDPTPFDLVSVTTTAQVILANVATAETITAETVTAITYNEIPYKYCVRSDIEQIFGKDNIVRWADLDNNGNSTEIDSRITYWIEKASREIDSKLRYSTYRIPFYDVKLDDVIIEMSARLAGYKMYASRGIQFNEDGKDIYFHHLREVKMKITDILRGKIRLDIRKADSFEYRRPEVLEVKLNNTLEDVIS